MFRKPRIPDDQRVTEENLRALFGDSFDVKFRTVYAGNRRDLKCVICYIDGLVGESDLSRLIVKPLTDPERIDSKLNAVCLADMMTDGAVYCATAMKREKLSDAAEDIMNGYCAVIVSAVSQCVTFEVRSNNRRNVEKPSEEKVVQGAKDAFTETFNINTALVRRKIKDSRLRLKKLTVGDKTSTGVAVVYLEGFTNSAMVSEAINRISAIKAEGFLSAAVLEENISDCPKTPFPQLISTERSDKFAMNILEGRVGILVEGMPLGFLAPGTFSQFLKVPEDHSDHFIVASVLTLLRYLSLILSLILPAFYVAVAMYHQEMIPAKLMLSIITAKQSVPFPTAAEVIAMLIAFELLQEAGLRLPNPIGETVSIIGALIVGQSAVEARVVSPVVVVVIALAGIAGYTMPSQHMGAALRVCRFLLVILAIAMGLFGITIGLSLLLYHLCSLETFGVPYMSPFAGGYRGHAGRALLRYSMVKKRDREQELGPEDE